VRAASTNLAGAWRKWAECRDQWTRCTKWVRRCPTHSCTTSQHRAPPYVHFMIAVTLVHIYSFFVELIRCTRTFPLILKLFSYFYEIVLKLKEWRLWYIVGLGNVLFDVNTFFCVQFYTGIQVKSVLYTGVRSCNDMRWRNSIT